MAGRCQALRSAIVGCGGISRAHSRVMAESADFEVVAVCDVREEAARAAAEKLPGATAYTDMQEMLAAAQPDVVAVCTATDSHARLTIEAAAAGAGVRGICCEKPMATCMGEGREMVAACRENGVSLIVNHQRRMGADLVQMRRLIEAGALGDVHLIRASCQGDLLSDGTHLVDSIRWLAGDEDVAWVLGQVYRKKPDPAEAKSGGYTASGGHRYGHPIETGAIGVLEFASGARAEMLCGGAHLPGRQYQDYEVFGTKGRLWRRGDRGEPPVLIQDERGGGWREAPLDPDIAGRQAMTESYRAFARMIRQGEPHPLSGDSSLKDLEVLMAAYESARTNAKVELPLEQDAFPLQLMMDDGRL